MEEDLKEKAKDVAQQTEEGEDRWEKRRQRTTGARDRIPLQGRVLDNKITDTSKPGSPAAQGKLGGEAKKLGKINERDALSSLGDRF